MATSPNKVCFRTALTVLLLCTVGAAQDASRVQVKFEIMSVTKLSDKAAAERTPDSIGPDIAVRLRLSTGERGVSFYGWPNGIVPSGYKIEYADNQIVWLFGNGVTAKQTSSPGINAVLFGSKGTWITLPPHAGVEWEELDSSVFAGKKHAFTAFVRDRIGDEKEIYSDQFTVPGTEQVGFASDQMPGPPISAQRVTGEFHTYAEVFAACSPDGRWLAFEYNELQDPDFPRVGIMRLVPGSHTWHPILKGKPGRYLYVGDFSWSPDSRWLALFTDYPDGAKTSGRGSMLRS